MLQFDRTVCLGCLTLCVDASLVKVILPGHGELRAVQLVAEPWALCRCNDR